MNKEVLFAFFPKMTPKRMRDVSHFFSSFEAAWHAREQDLRQIGWKDTLIAEFFAWRQSIDEKNILEALKKDRIETIPFSDERYPPLLRELYDPPLCLFVRGTLDTEHPLVAVVGPRKHSAYGKHVTETLVTDLAKHGISIVSGLALGIDGIAHTSTLDAHGKTIAVLGSGIDSESIYPRFHVGLAERIIENGGAIISEYPPGTKATSYTFPARNRIIAGLSRGVLVIEATESSGACITAQCAIDMNREVCAVPQNITSPTSAGVHRLIQQGAHLVTSADDIITLLNLTHLSTHTENRHILPDSPAEADILAALSREPTHVDRILKSSTLPSHMIMSTLTLLEMKGKIRNLGGMHYVLG